MKASKPKSYYKGPSNVVYNIDGTSCGLDEHLVDAIRASLREKMEKRALEIPRLPTVAARILQLSQDPDVLVSDVTNAIISDPVLAARVLKIANAAASGGEVRGLEPAIMRIGLRKLRDLVFAESMQAKVFPARAYRPLLDASWRVSLGAAITCEILSKMTGIEREGAFLMGLLHDIGKPTLVMAIMEYERKNGGAPIGEELVELVLSQLHEEIGGYVLQQWGMHEMIVAGARAHHRYDESRSAPPGHRLIHAANRICEHLGVGSEQSPVSFSVERVFLDLGAPIIDKIDGIVEAVSRDLESLLTGFGAVGEHPAAR
ncbi:HDOD domain-containing protein [bacterium]|nr:HDOD domain-containing protein [bacterium]